MKKISLAVLLVAGVANASPAGKIAGSKHDLSSTGPGAYRAVSETNPCSFCHVPHASGPKLTSRPDHISPSRPYESSTASAKAEKPTGSSRVCLSCHDGTVALGRTRNRDIEMVGGNRPLGKESRSNLGTDLRRSHPISVRPGVDGRTSNPHRGSAVRLGDGGKVECISCHDPHAEWGDPELGKFLVMPATGSRLCSTCHSSPGRGATSGHEGSVALVRRIDGKTVTVAASGCLACHDAHGAAPAAQLVKDGPTTDSPCLSCHDGSVARANIAAEVKKPSAHAARDREGHDAGEGRGTSGHKRLPETSPAARRHVACVDCHDPHASNTARSLAPAAGGAISGTWGIGLDGRKVEPVRFEYEVCLKCHGDSANKPHQPSAGAGGFAVARIAPDANLRRVFEPDSPSFHPVAAPGRNPRVPGLLSPLTVASIIYCTDCHSSDQSESGGPRGPHGSIYPSLLARQYLTSDFTAESPAAYALCYKCHSRDVLLSPGSGFPAHAAHVQKSATPCSACHAAHGVSRDAGTDLGNAHLVNFDRSIAKPGADGTVRYVANGPGVGYCNLTCHNRSHDERTGRYPSLP